ncbi:MAG: 1,4-alpha-glucan branching protein domain-containing protein [Planctomycetota bacterium]
MSGVDPRGACCVILHTHLPYVHHPEYEDFLEEDWLFEAIVECYLPLLEVYRGLETDGIPWTIAMSMTPPLVHMLRTPDLQRKFERYLARRLALAEKLAARPDRDPREEATAEHYVETYSRLTALWKELDGDLVAAFRDLAATGRLELLASSATHAFLPLLGRPEAVRAQIELGARLHDEAFGRRPEGFWLPECALDATLEAPLLAAGVRWVVVDRHGVANATPRPARAHFAPLRLPGGLHAFGRDPECSEQVWSSVIGYPGDPAYRELYRDVGFDEDYAFIRPFLKPDGIRRNVGLKFHCVTGKVGLDEKQLYDPALALERADAHAGDFLRRREEQIRARLAETGDEVVVTAPYDTELFGHWWYEGPLFLDRLFRRAAETPSEVFAFRHPGRLLDEGVAASPGEVALSTWGRRGFAEVWLNEANRWIWPHVHEAEERMSAWAERHRAEPLSPERVRLLAQMGRELLLAESSDWPFIITMETAAHYAERRVRDHVHRFLALEDALEGRAYELAELDRVERHDAIFPDLDPALWAPAAAGDPTPGEDPPPPAPPLDGNSERGG